MNIFLLSLLIFAPSNCRSFIVPFPLGSLCILNDINFFWFCLVLCQQVPNSFDSLDLLLGLSLTLVFQTARSGIR